MRDIKGLQVCGPLLEYALADLGSEETAEQCRELDGLPLLICKDGSIAKLSTDPGAESCCFIMSEADAHLLKNRAQSILAWPVSCPCLLLPGGSFACS